MRFAGAIAELIADGVTDIVIAGPGKIAQALVRANSKEVPSIGPIASPIESGPRRC